MYTDEQLRDEIVRKCHDLMMTSENESIVKKFLKVGIEYLNEMFGYDQFDIKLRYLQLKKEK